MAIKQGGPRYSVGYTRYVLGLLMAVYVYGFIDRQIIGILMEPIRLELGITDTQLGLLTGFAFALFYISLGIPIARLADVVSRKLVITAALTIWSMLTAVSGLTQNFVQLMFARIGVGIGEAGCTPPAHSLITDYFPPARRITALAIYSAAPAIGSMLAFLFGGWLNQFFGWRTAFIAIGLPGLLLALIVGLTLKEPPRGYSEGRDDQEPTPSFMTFLRHAWGQPSFRHIFFGMALVGFCSLGMFQWMPTFFMRSHDLQSGVVGTVMAFAFGIGGVLGALLGGVLADRWAARDARWYGWVAGLPLIGAVPLIIGTLTVSGTTASLTCFALLPFLVLFHMGPAYGTAHNLVHPRMRATASAVLLFAGNILGLGLGPVLVGAISDTLRVSYGEESLRWAILFFAAPAAMWAGLHFLLASRTLREDLAKVGWIAEGTTGR